MSILFLRNHRYVLFKSLFCMVDHPCKNPFFLGYWFLLIKVFIGMVFFFERFKHHLVSSSSAAKVCVLIFASSMLWFKNDVSLDLWVGTSPMSCLGPLVCGDTLNMLVCLFHVLRGSKLFVKCVGHHVFVGVFALLSDIYTVMSKLKSKDYKEFLACLFWIHFPSAFPVQWRSSLN